MHKEFITIDRMAFGGAGVGRLADGKVCFVPYAAPGDTAQVEVVRRKKNFCEGRLVSVTAPSPDRTAPPCPVFGTCGGCQLQHLSYEAQLSAKQDIFAVTLEKGGRVPRELVAPIVPSPDPFGYRSRIQLKLYHDGSRFHCGFHAPDSHFVVDCGGHCPIAAPAVNRAMRDLIALLRNFPDPKRLPQVDIASGDDDSVTFIFHYIGEMPEARKYLEDSLELLPTAVGVYLQQGRKSTLYPLGGSGTLHYGLSRVAGTPLRMGFGPGCFSQVNLEQNRRMVAQACEWANPDRNGRVLDLFCGNGNFSLPLAAVAAEVAGCEAYPPSIDDARANAAVNGVRNVRFEAIESASFVDALAVAGERFDVVMLDPPRAGAAAECRLIPRLRPERIVYVSCDPPTLARDVAILAAGGYRVVASRAFDMFPQTYHIESVTVLERT